MGQCLQTVTNMTTRTKPIASPGCATVHCSSFSFHKLVGIINVIYFSQRHKHDPSFCFKVIGLSMRSTYTSHTVAKSPFSYANKEGIDQPSQSVPLSMSL